MWWDYAQPNMCTICIEFTCAATRTIRLCRTYGSGVKGDTDEIYATRGENWMQSIPLLIIWMVFGFVFEEAMRVSITAQTHTYTSHGWLNNWTYTGRPVELSRASRTMWLLSATIIQDAFGYGCWVGCLLRLHEQNRILPDYREPECC